MVTVNEKCSRIMLRKSAIGLRTITLIDYHCKEATPRQTALE